MKVGRTILYAEDHEDIRRFAGKMMSLRGYDVLEASDGEEAIEMALANHPDLILMDMAMPGMNGIEAGLAIRSQPGAEAIPLVAVTAYGNHFREQALEAGFAEVVDKGLFATEMFTIIDKYLPQ
jgi:CheY-like chemotaxis protein